jgi:hypothetical protein
MDKRLEAIYVRQMAIRNWIASDDADDVSGILADIETTKKIEKEWEDNNEDEDAEVVAKKSIDNIFQKGKTILQDMAKGGILEGKCKPVLVGEGKNSDFIKPLDRPIETGERKIINENNENCTSLLIKVMGNVEQHQLMNIYYKVQDAIKCSNVNAEVENFNGDVWNHSNNVAEDNK